MGFLGLFEVVVEIVHEKVLVIRREEKIFMEFMLNQIDFQLLTKGNKKII